MKEYRIGEIFKLNGLVYQCVEDDKEEHCTICAFIDYNCKGIACWDTVRSDNKYVYFIRVAEPKEGVLFRAADGRLYELRDMTKIPIKEIYNCGCVKGAHWYPVKAQKGK